MTPWKESHKVNMADLYTRLRIEKHTIKPQQTDKEDLCDYKELLKDLNTNKRILIKGNPGIGKTTFSRKIVYDWANNKWVDSDLNSILLLFLVTLKYVGDDQTIEEMIKQQTRCLVQNKEIEEALLNEILQKYGEQCLVILDGYDEIPEEHNENLKAIIRNEVYRDCHFLLTSRPNAVEDIEGFMASIASVEGFSKENTRKYIEKVIKDKTKWEAAYKYTENSAIEEMWKYPILVLFLCLLVNWGAVDLDKENLIVGEFYTRLLNCIYRRFVVEKIKKMKQEEEESKQEETLLKIGKIAYHSLVTNKKTYRRREILKEVGPQAFHYGILIGTDEYEGCRHMPENADVFVDFPHKSIQEYLAAKYFIHKLSKCCSIEQLIGNQLKKRAHNRAKSRLVYPRTSMMCGMRRPHHKETLSRNVQATNLEFLKDNLMFLTFCGYFVNRKIPMDLDAASESEQGYALSSGKEKFIRFLAKCLDIEKVRLKGIAIYAESSWLFLEALPKCSHIQVLVLKDLKLQLPISFLLQGISKSIRSVTIDSCICCNKEEEHNTSTSITFLKLRKVKISGKQSPIKWFVESSFKALNTLNLVGYHSTMNYMKEIAQANSEKHFPFLKRLLFGKGKCKYVLDSDEESDNEESDNEESDIQNSGCKTSKDEKNKDETSEDEKSEDEKSEGEKSEDEKSEDEKSEDESFEDEKFEDESSEDESSEDESSEDESSEESDEESNLEKIDNEESYYEESDVNTPKSKIGGHIGILLSHGWLELRELNLNRCGLNRQDIEALAAANVQGFLPCMMYLHLNGNPDISGSINKLLNSKWPLLETLHLKKCNVMLDDVKAIAEAKRNGLVPNFEKVLKLKSDFCNVAYVISGDQNEFYMRKCDKQYLARKAPANLRQSIIKCDMAVNSQNPCQLEDILSIIWHNLHKIDLEECNLATNDVSALNEANRKGYLPCLVELKLSYNVAFSNNVSILLSHGWLELRELNLNRCGLNRQDIEALAAANVQGFLPCMMYLHLNGNPDISGSINKLLNSKWPLLRDLNLNECGFNRQDIEALTAANDQGVLPCIMRLYLNKNPDISGFIGNLLNCTWPQLEVLGLYNCNLLLDDIKAILQATKKGFLPKLENPNTLTLESNFWEVLLGKWKNMPKLFLERYDKCDLAAIAGANHHGLLQSVKEIDFSENPNISSRLDDILSSPWNKLQEVDLQKCNLIANDVSALDDANRKGYLPCLNILELSYNEALSNEVSMLLSHHWLGLIELSLCGCGLNRRDIEALAAANDQGFLPCMMYLHLDHNPDISGSISKLFNRKWSRLEVLYLDNCKLILDDDVAILGAMKDGLLPALKYPLWNATIRWKNKDALKLRQRDEKYLAVIARANHSGLLQSVVEIDLSENPNISSRLDNILSSLWNKLETLDLQKCNVTTNDVIALGEANRKQIVPCLNFLELSYNETLSNSVSLLFTCAWPALTNLSLAYCNLTNSDAKALGEANQLQYLPFLRRLDLEGCSNLSNQGLAKLFSHAWSRIHMLLLYNCSLTSEDGQVLLESVNKGNLPQIKKLGINDNNISSEIVALLKMQIDLVA